MVDPVVTALSQSSLSQVSLGQTEAPGTPETGPSPVNAKDVERFNAIMEPDAVSVQETASTTMRPVTATPETDSSLMQGLDAFSADNNRMHTNVVESLSHSGEMGDLFRVQFQVANLTTTQTLVGQTGQKGSQGVQTLLKGQ